MKENKYYLTDHYGWSQTDSGNYIRACRSSGELVYSIISKDKCSVIGGNAKYTKYRKNNRVDSESSYDTIYRFLDDSLWNSIGANIIRQVIRAGHAKKMYQTFCKKVGEHVVISEQFSYYLFPTPEKVLSLSDGDYAAMGMNFKKQPLKNAASFILENDGKLNDSDPEELNRQLQTINRIGEWTAGAALADFTNDWSLYPCDDAAIRYYAKEAKPEYKWPDNNEAFISDLMDLSKPYNLGDTVATLVAFHERRAHL